MKKIFLLLSLLAFTACSVPVDAPPPPTALPSFTAQPTLTSAVSVSPIPAATDTPAIVPTSLTSADLCADTRSSDVIEFLRTAVQAKDGALLASLVSPAVGMDVIFIRNGNVINYDIEHAKFVFETTFQAEWGPGAGSGEPVIGAFQEIILPSLQLVFTPTAVITCNELKTGGATYIPEWPYPGMDFYSVHFPGTEQYAGMDWETWAVGMVRQEGKPVIAAMVHYEWEP